VFDKAALKRLTQSDLTFFEWHFRNRNAGNQKSVNLNADVFIDTLYPALPTIARGIGDKVPIDLFLYGPGRKPAQNLQRKIIKGTAYKNWRLNGEFGYSPENDPERFNSLEPGDLALMLFEGDPQPVTLHLYLVSDQDDDDRNVHRELAAILGPARMNAIDLEGLRRAITAAAPVTDHPINDILLEDALVDAAIGGLAGIDTLLRRRSALRISALDLQKARENAENAGRLGEELVNAHLLARQQKGEIVEFAWVSEENAVSPYDFTLRYPTNDIVKLDVKSTSGPFERAIHISMSELREMALSNERYDLYRVYLADRQNGYLRIFPDARQFANRVISTSASLPKGVTIDSISVDPRTLSFGDEIPIEVLDEEEVTTPSLPDL
jgi:hypothetical protein